MYFHCTNLSCYRVISGKLTFLHDGYIAAIENCCASIAVIIPYARSIIAVRRLIQHDICYARKVIVVIRPLVQYEVVPTEFYT